MLETLTEVSAETRLFETSPPQSRFLRLKAFLPHNSTHGAIRLARNGVTGSGFDSSLGKPLLSRVIDLKSQNSFCASEFGISGSPNVTEINKWGGFNISYPRLAIVNGLADVWREATPAADTAKPRTSTASEPWIVIDDPPADVWDGLRGAGHHWEANGVFANQTQAQQPPKAIAAAQADIVDFVGAWIAEWKEAKAGA
jgi:hypothetical protein